MSPDDPERTSAALSQRRFQPLSKHAFEPVRCRLPNSGPGMRRRNFLGLLGGAAAAWPFNAYAQQSGRVRRIGVLMSLAESDPVALREVQALEKTLGELGWRIGGNIQIEYRWAAGNVEQMQAHAKALVRLQCDLIVGRATPVVAALRARPKPSRSYSCKSQTRSAVVT